MPRELSKSKKKAQKPAPTGESKFYEEVLNPRAWKQIVAALRPVVMSLSDSPSHTRALGEMPAQTLSDSDIEAITSRVLKRVPFYLRKARRPALTSTAADDLRRRLPSFLKQSFSAPNIDGEFLRRNAEFSGLKVRLIGKDCYVLANGLPGIVLLDVKDGGKVKLGNTAEDKSTVAQIAFIVDILLEITGLILGIIGLAVPFTGDAKAVEEMVSELARKTEFKAALRKLLKALQAGDFVEVLSFFEFLEQSGNLSEFLAHYFAGLGYWDYIWTIGKFVAWILAAFASGGAAIALHVAELGLDIIGIGKKLSDAGEVF